MQFQTEWELAIIMTFKESEIYKIRAFVKTYLYLKGSATSKELSTAINSIDLSIPRGVTPNEMSRILMNSLSSKSKHFLNDLTFKKKRNTRIWYLKKEGDL